MAGELEYVPDIIERCQLVLNREWLRSSGGDPWFIDRPVLENFIRQDQLFLVMPESWRRLLVLANIPPDDIPNIPTSWHLTLDDWNELATWSANLGPRPDFTRTEADDLWPGEEINEEPPKETKPDEPEKGGDSQAEEVKKAIEDIEAAYRGQKRLTGAAAAVAVCLLAAFLLIRAEKPKVDQVQYLAYLQEKKAHEEEKQAREAAVRDLQASQIGESDAKLKLSDLEKNRAELVKQGKEKDARLSQFQDLYGESPIPLSVLSQEHAAASGSQWDSRQPVFTAIRETKPVFTWNPSGRTGTVRMRIVEAKTGKDVPIPGDVPAASGEFTGSPRLRPGTAYRWGLVGEEHKDDLQMAPFYVLGTEDANKAAEALKNAKTFGERLAILTKYRLYDEVKRAIDKEKQSIVNHAP